MGYIQLFFGWTCFGIALVLIPKLGFFGNSIIGRLARGFVSLIVAGAIGISAYTISGSIV